MWLVLVLKFPSVGKSSTKLQTSPWMCGTIQCFAAFSSSTSQELIHLWLSMMAWRQCLSISWEAIMRESGSTRTTLTKYQFLCAYFGISPANSKNVRKVVLYLFWHQCKSKPKQQHHELFVAFFAIDSVEHLHCKKNPECSIQKQNNEYIASHTWKVTSRICWWCSPKLLQRTPQCRLLPCVII